MDDKAKARLESIRKRMAWDDALPMKDARFILQQLDAAEAENRRLREMLESLLNPCELCCGEGTVVTFPICEEVECPNCRGRIRQVLQPTKGVNEE